MCRWGRLVFVPAEEPRFEDVGGSGHEFQWPLELVHVEVGQGHGVSEDDMAATGRRPTADEPADLFQGFLQADGAELAKGDSITSHSSVPPARLSLVRRTSCDLPGEV